MTYTKPNLYELGAASKLVLGTPSGRFVEQDFSPATDDTQNAIPCAPSVPQLYLDVNGSECIQ